MLERMSEAVEHVWFLFANWPICVWRGNFAKRRKVPNLLNEDADIDCIIFGVPPTIG